MSEDKKKAAIVGGFTLAGLLLAVVGIILCAPSSKPAKKRDKKASSRFLKDDSFVMREIVNEAIQSPENTSKLAGKEDKLAPVAEVKDATEQEVVPPVISEFKSENKEDEEAVVLGTITKQTDTPEQPLENSAAVPNTKRKASSRKKKAPELTPEDFTEVFEKDYEELLQWLCAVKAIYDIQKERAVLKHEMALAKKLDNQEEKDRIKDKINARREVLNAERRAACLRANSREWQAIKDKRRELTREMTRARRAKKKGEASADATMERVMTERSSLKQRVKKMNNQIKQWQLFVSQYKQSRQAA